LPTAWGLRENVCNIFHLFVDRLHKFLITLRDTLYMALTRTGALIFGDFKMACTMVYVPLSGIR